jgi:hypothetical protein
LSDDPKAMMDVAKAGPAQAAPGAAAAAGAKPVSAQPAVKKPPPVVTPAQANKLDSILN